MRQIWQRTAAAVIGGAVLVALPGAGLAQALFEEQSLRAACRTDACGADVAATLARLRDAALQEPELNSQIGMLAAVLLDAAEAVEPEALPWLAAGLGELERATTDRAQAAAIGRVARAVASGQAGSVPAASAYASASPSRPFNWWNRPRPPRRSGPPPGWSRNRWSDFWRR